MEEFKTILLGSPDLIPLYLETNQYRYSDGDYNRMIAMINERASRGQMDPFEAKFYVDVILKYKLEESRRRLLVLHDIDLDNIRRYGCNKATFIDADGVEKPMTKAFLLFIAKSVLGLEVTQSMNKGELCALIDREVLKGSRYSVDR